MAILQVAKDSPMVGDIECRFSKDAAIEFVGIGIVILQVAIGEVSMGDFFIGDIGHIAEVVALEVLHREAADDVPMRIAVFGVPNEAIGMLGEAFFANGVGFYGFSIGFELVDAEFLCQLVVIAKLIIVAVTIGVVQRRRRRPVLVDFPGGREEVVVLPEVVGGTVPIAAVVHLVALGHVVSVFVFDKVAFLVGNKVFVERVELSQAHVPHVGVGLDTRVCAVGAVHKAEVVVARHYAVPSLSGSLKVADVFVA